MNIVERTFRLDAPEGLGGKPRPELIGPVLTHLHGTLQDSVRMGFLHASRARGRIPSSLKAASEVRYVGHSAEANDDATLLRFEVPTFVSAAPELFAQQTLWADGPKPEDTAFELLSGWLHDIGRKHGDSSRFDPGLLLRVRQYGRLIGRKQGLSRISLPDSATPERGQIDSTVLLAAQELSAVTPEARRTRITGVLDVLGVSDRVLKLQVGDAVVTAVWQRDQPVVALATLLGREVVLEGDAVFRPSGKLLRVDADAIEAAGASDAFFRKLPTPVARKELVKAARATFSEASSYSAIRGAIEAEESEEDFAAAVEALS